MEGRKAIFGVQARADDGSVFGVMLAPDKRTPISPCMELSAEKFKSLRTIAEVVE